MGSNVQLNLVLASERFLTFDALVRALVIQRVNREQRATLKCQPARGTTKIRGRCAQRVRRVCARVRRSTRSIDHIMVVARLTDVTTGTRSANKIFFGVERF